MSEQTLPIVMTLAPVFEAQNTEMPNTNRPMPFLDKTLQTNLLSCAYPVHSSHAKIQNFALASVLWYILNT